MYLPRIVLTLLICVTSSLAVADSSGPLGMDHRLAFDDAALWSSGNLKAVEYGSALLVLGGAIYEGNESRLGKTFWKTVDAMLLGDVSAAAAKASFRRQRPIDGNDPGAFFKSSSDNGFPSGSMTHITAIVTPFILEYQKDTPAVWLLAALPAYVGLAKLKTQEHWQTDILAGAALGIGVGYFATRRDGAWSAHVLPDGFSVGYKKSF
jgi:hypothetical protein